MYALKIQRGLAYLGGNIKKDQQHLMMLFQS